MGRFTNPDLPLIDQNPADPQSWNLYGYVRNNPLSLVDLNGRSCIKLDGGSSGDDGDGKGCQDAGVTPDDKNGKGKITPQVVDVGGESAPAFGTAEWTRKRSETCRPRSNAGTDPTCSTTSSFGYDQNDSRPSCFGGFLVNTASNINPLPPSLSTVGDLAGQAGTFYWFQRAVQHAATTPSRTFGTPFLMYPNKSSVFRSLLSKSGRFRCGCALSLISAFSKGLSPNLTTSGTGGASDVRVRDFVVYIGSRSSSCWRHMRMLLGSGDVAPIAKWGGLIGTSLILFGYAVGQRPRTKPCSFWLVLFLLVGVHLGLWNMISPGRAMEVDDICPAFSC